MEVPDNDPKLVLAIDDDVDIRAALRVVLVAEGFAVGEASSGEEGLKIAKRANPDAIILDLMMERVDSGTALARELRDAGYTGPIYVLSSAGESMRQNIDTRELRVTGIFQKPVNPKTIVDTIKARFADEGS